MPLFENWLIRQVFPRSCTPISGVAMSSCSGLVGVFLEDFHDELTSEVTALTQPRVTGFEAFCVCKLFFAGIKKLVIAHR